MPFEYLPRVSDVELRERLEVRGAVLIEGPKWCGKTTSAEQIAGSVLYMQDPSARARNLRLAEISPRTLLEGTSPRLIDEWQIAPQLWDSVRFEVDRRRDVGQFILTGSAVPTELPKGSHTGTGRIGRMRMRPMSLLESGDSSGKVSLRALFSGELVATAGDERSLEEVAFLLCRGGWPQAVRLGTRAALRQAMDYLDEVAESDVSRLDGVSRNPLIARHLMRSYARMSSSQGKLTQIVADVESQGRGASETTIRDYILALNRIFVFEDLQAWNPNLRSKASIRTAPTRHFVDPSIAAAALGIGPGDLMEDLETFGLLFESLCIRDLRVYASALDGNVYHYRDNLGLEADAVVHLRNGCYGLVEIKLGGEDLIAEGAKNLLKLANKIDQVRMGRPSFLMIVTAVGSYAYPRTDGVFVCPITCLGV